MKIVKVFLIGMLIFTFLMSWSSFALVQAQEDSSVSIEYEPEHEIPSNFPSERAGIYYVSGGGGYPIFCGQFIADPEPVFNGELQIFSIGVKDPEGIEKVTGEIHATFAQKIIIFEMELVEGTPQDGIWIGAWQARYLYPDPEGGSGVHLTLTAFNTKGETTKLAAGIITDFPPTIELNDIPNSVSKQLESISGTAFDGEGLDKVLVSIKNTAENSYWDGSSWVTVETWLEALGAESWSSAMPQVTWSYSMPALTIGKSYEVKAKAIDKVGTESAVTSDSFFVTLPTDTGKSYVWLAGAIGTGVVVIVSVIIIYFTLRSRKPLS